MGLQCSEISPHSSHILPPTGQAPPAQTPSPPCPLPAQSNPKVETWKWDALCCLRLCVSLRPTSTPDPKTRQQGLEHYQGAAGLRGGDYEGSVACLRCMPTLSTGGRKRGPIKTTIRQAVNKGHYPSTRGMWGVMSIWSSLLIVREGDFVQV